MHGLSFWLFSEVAGIELVYDSVRTVFAKWLDLLVGLPANRRAMRFAKRRTASQMAYEDVQESADWLPNPRYKYSYITCTYNPDSTYVTRHRQPTSVGLLLTLTFVHYMGLRLKFVGRVPLSVLDSLGFIGSMVDVTWLLIELEYI